MISILTQCSSYIYLGAVSVTLYACMKNIHEWALQWF
jgi:hypothetical protein